jgi:acetyltransferase-like isoleucine patch superfamily enzyme
MALVARVMSKLRCLSLRRRGARIGRGVTAPPSLVRGDATGLSCESGTYFCDGVRLLIGHRDGKPGQLHIGPACFFNHYAVIDCHFSVEIGKRVMIGPHTYIGDFDHELALPDDGDGVAMPVTGKTAAVRLEDDVWVGAGAVILKGVVVGRGAVVAAGSVVTRDVPPISIVGGVPARVIGERKRRTVESSDHRRT